MTLIRLFAAIFFLTSGSGLAFAQPLYVVDRVVSTGRTQKIDYFIALDPTCQPLGPITINMLDEPHAGRVEVVHGREYPGFAQFNARARCNTHKVPATQLLYTAASGYTGEDAFTIERVGPYGVPQRWRYRVTVR